MTTWAKMSKTKRCWMVYRTVCFLEPDAIFPKIRNDLEQRYGVTLSPSWLLKRLDNFTNYPDIHSRRPVLREELRRCEQGAIQVWHPTREPREPRIAS